MGSITQELHPGERRKHACAAAPLSAPPICVRESIRRIWLHVGVCRTLGSTRRATTLCRPLKGSRFPSSSPVTLTSSWKRWRRHTRVSPVCQEIPPIFELPQLHWFTTVVPAVAAFVIYFPCILPSCICILALSQTKSDLFHEQTSTQRFSSLLLSKTTFFQELRHKWCVLLFPAEAKQRSLWTGRRWGVHHARGVRIPEKVRE